MKHKMLAAALLCVVLLSPIPISSAFAGYNQHQAYQMATAQIPIEDRSAATEVLKQFLRYMKNYDVENVKGLLCDPKVAKLLCDKSDGFLYSYCRKQNRKLSFSKLDAGGFVTLNDEGEWCATEYTGAKLCVSAKVKYRDHSKAFRKALKEYSMWYSKASKSGRLKVSNKKSKKHFLVALKRNIKRYGFKQKSHTFSVTVTKVNGEWKLDFSDDDDSFDEIEFQTEMDCFQMGWYKAYSNYYNTSASYFF